MKYSIRESSGPYPSELLRYGKIMGEANNAELEFWARIQELEEQNKKLEDRLSQWMRVALSQPYA